MTESAREELSETYNSDVENPSSQARVYIAALSSGGRSKQLE